MSESGCVRAIISQYRTNDSSKELIFFCQLMGTRAWTKMFIQVPLPTYLAYQPWVTMFIFMSKVYSDP